MNSPGPRSSSESRTSRGRAAPSPACISGDPSTTRRRSGYLAAPDPRLGGPKAGGDPHKTKGRYMKLYASLAVAAVLAVGVAAGCGSSNDDSSTSTAAISKAEFQAKANAVCKQGNDEVEAAGKQLGNVSGAQLERFAAVTVLPNIQKQLDGVKALGASAGEEAQVNQLVSTVQG